VNAADIARKDTVILDIDGGRVDAPDLWNPYLPASRLDNGFHQSMMEPLFILNYETGKIEPWVGDSMTANAGQDVWTLKMHQGVTWSDGQPFNADDIVFTINMLIQNAPQLNNSAAMKEWVKSVKKIDDTTVEFDLNKPNPRFQLDYFSVKIWGGVNFVPKHIWDGQDPLKFKNYDTAKGWPVFSGAYKLASVSPTEFTYVRDDNWWGAKTGFKPLPAPKKLVWTWAGPEETRTALMADKKLDSLMDITYGAFQALQARNPKVIAWYPKLPFAVLDPCARMMQVNNAVPPWDDKDMRWALSYAMDRDQIAKIAYEGTSVPAINIFPAYPPLVRFTDLLKSKGLYDKYPVGKYDPAKAKQIIESKGYTKGSDGYYQKDGKPLTLEIETHEAFIELQRDAQVYVEQLQNIGINATMKNVAGAQWGDNMSFGKSVAQAGWQACGSVSEPWASMDNFNSKWIVPVGQRANTNFWRWNNADYSKIVDQIGQLPLGDPKIDDLFVQAETIWLDQLPIIPMTQAKKLIPFDTTYWTNWPTSDNPYHASWTWWQSTIAILDQIKPAQ
jgi:peptide/nickel transport system substrate-binding protein